MAKWLRVSVSRMTAELSRKINRCQVLKQQNADKVPRVAPGSPDAGAADCSGLMAGDLAEGAGGTRALQLAGRSVWAHACVSVCMCVSMWALCLCVPVCTPTVLTHLTDPEDSACSAAWANLSLVRGEPLVLRGNQERTSFHLSGRTF